MQSKSNALWVIPIIIDGAEESACDVVRCTSICLGCSRKGQDRRWDAVVQPISNGFLQDSCIMATSIFCSMLKLRQRRHQRSPKICWQRAYRSQAGVKIFGIVDLLLELWNERVQELNSDIAPFTSPRECHGFLWGTGTGWEFRTPKKPVPVARVLGYPHRDPSHA